MKLSGLALIAIIIILPMTIILSDYTSNQIATVRLQNSYDSKLINSTYDAIKTFQLNMSNSSTSDLADSKMRDIQASINMYYEALASNFNMAGYGKEVLQEYTPAVVYTLYDGYYIYSAYTNTLDAEDKYLDEITKDTNYPYPRDEIIYGLKPYVYYSCRYKKDNDNDVTITYSLDSYITIQGLISGNPINDAGYLLTGVAKEGEKIYYRGVEILENEEIFQNVYLEAEEDEVSNSNLNEVIKIEDSQGHSHKVGEIKQYPCRKVNGVKYYWAGENAFAIINDKKYQQSNIDQSVITANKSGKEFYEKALNFKQRLKELGKLEWINPKNAQGGNSYTGSNFYIFEELENEYQKGEVCIEDENSNFNAHRLEVIKNSIESNLITAISNYNQVSNVEVNFAMPKIKAEEWEQITNNVCMITFLQGLNIGGKIYSGYAIVPNNSNEDFVSENSIYILKGDGDGDEDEDKYYRVTSSELVKDGVDLSEAQGIFNIDFERRTGQATYKEFQYQDASGNDVYKDISKTIYYYPYNQLASYNSIIEPNDSNIEPNDNKAKSSIYQYFKGVEKGSNKYKLAQVYYTALGREREGLYRVNNKLEEIQEQMREQTPEDSP